MDRQDKKPETRPQTNDLFVEQQGDGDGATSQLRFAELRAFVLASAVEKQILSISPPRPNGKRGQEIKASLARHTPDDTLIAIALEYGCVLDLAVSNSVHSSSAMSILEQIDDVRSNLRSVMRQAGYDTRVADTMQMNETRSFLQKKGLADAEVEQALRRSHSWLGILAPYLPQESPDDKKTPARDTEKQLKTDKYRSKAFAGTESTDVIAVADISSDTWHGLAGRSLSPNRGRN